MFIFFFETATQKVAVFFEMQGEQGFETIILQQFQC